MVIGYLFLILSFVFAIWTDVNKAVVIKDRINNWYSAEFDHTYTMRSVGEYMKEQQGRKELLVFNYENTRSA